MRHLACLAVLLAVALPLSSAAELTPCRLKGIEREVRCGQVEVPENPAQPDGRKLAIHFAVVPAVAKNKAPDPLVILAGGPGQAGSAVAGMLQPVLARINARRDLVYLDQRGTGKSNRLACDAPGTTKPLPEAVDAARSVDRLAECAARLPADTRQYATWIASRDLDAVRAALGVQQLNLWGASYGTRAALDYLRQYPQQVRSMVLDGVAPPDMVLPVSFAVDADAALEKLIAACAADARCRTRLPDPAAAVERLLTEARAGKTVDATDPLTGRRESIRMDRLLATSLLRAPLYLPQLAAVLPEALLAAGRGDYGPLVTLATAFAGPLESQIAEVMHFAVICAEDLPRLDAAQMAQAERTRFGTDIVALYRRACAQLPSQPAPAAFYALPTAAVPVLLLSGGADPATPPRHAERVAKALPRRLHLVAPNLGHGVTPHGCAPDLIARFVRQASFEGIDGACLQKLPAPPLFAPPAGPVVLKQ
jgi:pimeloyl-ACP methyl ester carboxylesterase